jgi:beta-N-acetylhexosaminidase
VILIEGRGDSGSDQPLPTPGISAETATRVQQMSTADLADQVLLLGFDGTDGSAPFLDEVRSRQLGGVFVGAGNWTDAAAGTALVAAIRAAGRKAGRIPPLVVASQEGGRYRSFADLPPELTELEIGDRGSAKQAEAWARDSAAALRSAGFDLDLFPLADRAFSDDPADVTELTAAAIAGCREAGLACAALHFPGLGGASEDTDQGPATVGLDAGTLEARDLAPFSAAFDQGMPAVVVSLAFYAAYDAVIPGALSAPVVTGLLRTQLGYEGVAITDDLGAGAVRSGYSVPKAAVAALAAGSDMIRIDEPADQAGVQGAIADAVDSGALPIERLQQAAARVLEMKRLRGLTAG